MNTRRSFGCIGTIPVQYVPVVSFTLYNKFVKLTCCSGNDLKPAMSCMTLEITETRESAVSAKRKIMTKGYPRIRRHIGVFRAASNVLRFNVAAASDACQDCIVWKC